MSDEDQDKEVTTKKACSVLKEELLSCLLKSDCMIKDGKTVRECMAAGVPGVNEDCRRVQFTFFECRRSMLDMRNRFRGRKGN